ncbi:uncharacterized protein LOC124896244 [Capsicum annuum]|uniref:uncharacterized protein LOC124896244 n=1 Tax=Capsicum annuum TaxID=4072 RepID=UPI001FB1323D|nr:uncharacterized protein LOC124896244 [Capsicum annuum]
MCLALLYAIKKLRHYFEAYTIKLISQADPVKFVMTQPILLGRLARWSVLFNQYEIIYTPQKAVKRQTLANFLTDHPLPAEWEDSGEFSDEDVLFTKELLPCTMLFDGSACRDGAEVGVVLISQEKLILPFSFVLGEICSNNVAEYQDLIVGLNIVLEMNIPQLDIYGDSKLIINQLLGSYEVKKEDLLPYHQYAILLLERFNQVFLNHVPREENCMADALANLTTTLACGENKSTKLEALDEKRLEAQQRLECYKARLARAFYKRVRPRSFQVGDLVLVVRRPIILNKRIGDKFTSRWDGPYVVKEVYSSVAYKIVDQDGIRVKFIQVELIRLSIKMWADFLKGMNLAFNVGDALLIFG